MSERKVVLVTGASSGIGQAIARMLAQKGFIVFGTSRNSSGGEKMSGMEILPLDVHSEDSVQACVNAVLTKAKRLDILINNAGYELAGALEETSIEEAKSQFETNFFGVMRMIKAVLPFMRQQRSGQLINIGSVLGLTPAPFLGGYSASKSAVEGYTEILRHEVRPFNIRVSLVEPGFIKTSLAHNRQYAANRISDYDPWRQRIYDAFRQYEEKAPDPTLVADCVLRIIEGETPKLRYRVGRDATLITRLRRFLPAALFERVVRDYFHLDAKK
jgi:NAD(P)-dependent dehydrogenase (short-subunit alcohol dehydrogenase family)